jgi:hypothetical protein
MRTGGCPKAPVGLPQDFFPTFRCSLGRVTGGGPRTAACDAAPGGAVGEPAVLVEADAGGEWKVGTDAHEHPSPSKVIDIGVVRSCIE